MLTYYQVIPVRLANSGKHGYVFHTFLSPFKAFQKEPVEPPYPCLKARGIRRPFHEVSADMQIHFEFFDTIDDYWMPYRGKMFERTPENAFRTVAFQLLDGPFVIDEPYQQQHTYRYLLRFSANPFPEDEGRPDPDKSLLDFYGWVSE